jgi:hypothetical protein
MLQPTCSSSFASEPCSSGLIFTESWIQNFYCYYAIDQDMARSIDRAHPTDTQTSFHAVLIIERVPQQRICLNNRGIRL